MQYMIKNYRTMFLFRGIAALLFGAFTLVWPSISLTVLVLLFGIFAVINGITSVSAALRGHEQHEWGFLLFEGVLSIVTGAVALVWPGITALAFLFLIAAWAILTGILQLVVPLSFPMSLRHGLLVGLSGLASIVFGMLIAPIGGLLALAWLIGTYAIIVGIIHIVVYFEARSLVPGLA